MTAGLVRDLYLQLVSYCCPESTTHALIRGLELDGSSLVWYTLSCVSVWLHFRARAWAHNREVTTRLSSDNLSRSPDITNNWYHVYILRSLSARMICAEDAGEAAKTESLTLLATGQIWELFHKPPVKACVYNMDETAAAIWMRVIAVPRRSGFGRRLQPPGNSCGLLQTPYRRSAVWMGEVLV